MGASPRSGNRAAAHGGLKLSCERWLDLPEEVRRSFIHPLFPEEDCEAPIALTILGLADRETREAAIWAARQFTIYGSIPVRGRIVR